MISFEKLRAGKAACPSDFALDQLHANELVAESVALVNAHVESCVDCQARMSLRSRGFAAIEGLDERAVLARIRQRAETAETKTWWSRFIPVVVMGAAVVVALLVWPRAPAEDARFKGALLLRVFKLQAGHPVEVNSGDQFSAGDALRFVVTLPTSGHIKILDVDSRGAVSTAWPQDRATVTAFPAGSGIELPGAVSLDDSTGGETFHLVQCAKPEAIDACAAEGKTQTLQCGSGCTTSAFTVRRKAK